MFRFMSERRLEQYPDMYRTRLRELVRAFLIAAPSLKYAEPADQGDFKAFLVRHPDITAQEFAAMVVEERARIAEEQRQAREGSQIIKPLHDGRR